MVELIAPSIAAQLVARRPSTGTGRPDPALERAAVAFEGAFLAQLLGAMTAGLGGKDSPFAGPYGSLLVEQYGELLARSGGIGIKDALVGELVRMQEPRR
jgi:Rod binding domain-containing protein